MSSPFADEAKNIIANAPKPDADAKIIKELSPVDSGDETIEKPKKKRKYTKRKTSTRITKAEREHIERSARALNTFIFTSACAFLGTGEAWPEKDQEEVMDKALARYLEDKGYSIPPEIILFGAYSVYVKDLSVKPTIREKFAEKMGFIKKFKSVKFWGFLKKKHDANKQALKPFKKGK